MKTDFLRRAPNGIRSAEAEKWIEEALDNNFQFTSEFLRKQGWLVVPVESALHFDKHDVECLAKAALFYSEKKIRAVLLEELQNARNHLEFDATKEGWVLFDRECAHFNYALLPEGQSFAVICTTNDYYLVAGSKYFLEIALGKKISEALTAFADFARSDFWDEAQKTHLVDLYINCRDIIFGGEKG